MSKVNLVAASLLAFATLNSVNHTDTARAEDRLDTRQIRDTCRENLKETLRAKGYSGGYLDTEDTSRVRYNAYVDGVRIEMWGDIQCINNTDGDWKETSDWSVHLTGNYPPCDTIVNGINQNIEEPPDDKEHLNTFTYATICHTGVHWTQNFKKLPDAREIADNVYTISKLCYTPTDPPPPPPDISDEDTRRICNSN